MNKHTIFVAVFGAALVFASCKKTDEKNEMQIQKPNAVSTSAQWKTLNNWSSQNEEQYIAYSNSIEDSSITPSVASNGLVLAYKKSGNTVVALPSDEQATNGSYTWYYQISNGTMVFSADVYGQASKPDASQSFAYFIVTPDKLNDLESKGYSKAQLMKLSYDDAASLLK